MKYSIDDQCPRCQDGTLFEIRGMNNDYLGCDTYPLCTFRYNYPKPKKFNEEEDEEL